MTDSGFDALRVLEVAEELERTGQAFYLEAAGTVSDDKVRKMLLGLAEAENRHLRLIEDLRIGLGEAFPTLLRQDDGDEEQVSTLTTRFKEVLFPEAPSTILADTTKPAEIQVLERGRQLEEEAIRLYEDAAEREADPGASNAFRRLVMEERIHLYMLNRRLDLLKLRRLETKD